MIWLNQLWYRKKLAWFCYLLLPLEGLYRCIVFLRRVSIKKNNKQPVIVVGNLTVGGTGKTPCVIALAQELKQRGFQPGIVSRGYGGKAPSYPYQINNHTRVHEVGDEALLLYRKTQLPMLVDPKRQRAVQQLLKLGCDVIISDDGLQHQAMGRCMEIVLIDGLRRLGNQHCLPVGPLRESKKRLQTVDYIFCNGKPNAGELELKLTASDIYRLCDSEKISLPELANKKIHAVAGIGNPQRFFSTLSQLNLAFTPHEFRDHHRFCGQDFAFLAADEIVVMTEKDAIKCAEFADQRFYVFSIKAELPTDFLAKMPMEIASMVDIR